MMVPGATVLGLIGALASVYAFFAGYLPGLVFLCSYYLSLAFATMSRKFFAFLPPISTEEVSPALLP